MKAQEITLIYDGQCRFCKASLNWLQKRLQVKALAFQGADLETYGVSSAQCSKEVFAFCENQRFAGADAIAFLLERRGNKVAALLIKSSGSLGHFGYRWVASHRNSLLIRIATRILEKS
jgi:predicted DCC family thiol-disulfide oxidoreductase YuxK